VTAWTAFASVAGVVTVLLLLLSHSTSQRFGVPADSVDEDAGSGDDETVTSSDDDTVTSSGANAVGSIGDDAVTARDGDALEKRDGDSMADLGSDQELRDDGVHGDAVGDDAVREDGDVSLPGGREGALARELSGAPELSQPLLLLNVALSQGVFAVVLVAAAVLGDVPAAALGVGDGQLSGWFVLVGVALGVALYGANEVGSALADAAGLGRSEELREFLAPNSRPGWIVLLGGVLPIVAGFEELLFRGVLVGAFATGFGVSPWVLVLASSVLFGLGHGAQGRLGVLVTGSLGFVLGAAFVLTDSLLVVVVAHYLVNALEFVVHER
jgi:membrane protease YdiL (CAAX protease family)